MKTNDPEIKKYEFKPNLLVEFEIITISSLYKKNKSILTKPHRTNFYQIFWIQKGTPVHHINFNPVSLFPNSLLFIAKDCVQVFDSEGNYEGKLILFTEDFYCRNIYDSTFLKSTILFNELYSKSPVHIRSSRDNFSVILQQMETELISPKDNYQHPILKNLLSNFLLLSEREKRQPGFEEIKPGAELEHLISFKELLEKNFLINKSVNKYASELNISEKTLNNATSLILNKTPKEIIDERVILEAKLLLAYKTSGIKEIAFKLGFEELTNFIKYFRRHTSLSPSEYRESLL